MESSKSYQDKSAQKVLTKKDLNKIVLRSFLLQSSFNYERMQAGGWTFSLIPGLKKIHKNQEDLATSLTNHMQFINTSPQLVTFMNGVIISMEEAKEEPSTIQAIKSALMGPLGGIGDALFFLTILPIASGIGASLAKDGNILGPFVFLLIFNIPFLAAKFGLMRLGYDMGVKAISALSESTKKLSRAATIVGLSVVSALIPRNVNLSLTSVLKFNGVELDLQKQLLDSIMPSMLPLLFALFCFYMLRKGKSPIFLIVFAVVLGLVGSFFNIL